MFQTRKSYIALAIAFLLSAASCSDETLQTNQASYNFGPDGKAYMSLSLDVPYDHPGTRAATFEDGDKDEYHVSKATFVIFGCDPSTPPHT